MEGSPMKNYEVLVAAFVSLPQDCILSTSLGVDNNSEIPELDYSVF